ncbi:assembly factor cbp4 [Thelotrema lepadinum]|nr:assembly factor cbp4 [Thelotrema lepadinum]
MASRARTLIKMGLVGTVVCIGGPALVYYVTPTEEELFKRYNPELQKRSLANREQAQKDFDNFVGKLKEYSKSSKTIWDVAAEDQARIKAQALEEQEQVAAAAKARSEQLRQEAMSKR